ncbi:MAG: hypothetical protein QXE76_03990 [Candidatus Bathyarchaeia archaeon]
MHHMIKKTNLESQKPRKLKVCPRCGSTKIGFSSKFDAWLMPKQYICYDCGYFGPIILELEKEKDPNQEA